MLNLPFKSSSRSACGIFRSIRLRSPVTKESCFRPGILAAPSYVRIEFYKNLKRFCIFYNETDRWRTVGRVRFSVAHELAHFYLPSHRDRLLSGIMHNSVADFGSRSPTEIEADEFAADLLMPMELFRAALDLFRNGFCDLDDLARLADRLGTSITSTARRYCESDREPCTIFFSEQGIVRWGHSSEDMKRTGMFYYPYDTAPPSGSKAAEFWSAAEAGKQIEKLSGPVPSRTWFRVATGVVSVGGSYGTWQHWPRHHTAYARRLRAMREFLSGVATV